MMKFHRSYFVIIPLISILAFLLIFSGFFRFLLLFCITVFTSIVLFCVLLLFIYVNNSNSRYHSGESNYEIGITRIKSRLQQNVTNSSTIHYACNSKNENNTSNITSSINGSDSNRSGNQKSKSGQSPCDCGLVKVPLDRVQSDYHFGPYPSKRVAEMMQQLCGLIVQEYLLPIYIQQNWKTDTTEDIRCHVAKLFERLTLRLSRIDWVTFVCNRWIRDFQEHLESAMPNLGSADRLSHKFMSHSMERQYAESVAERILVHVLDKQLFQCATIKRVLVTIIAHQVIIPTANYVCDPYNLSLWFMNYLKDRYKNASRSKRALYQYNSSYEEFFSAINALDDKRELKAIGQKISTEIRLVEVILLTKKNIKGEYQGSEQSSNKDLGKLDKGQLLVRRDLSRYRNQLNMCYRKVNRRLQVLSSKEKNQSAAAFSDCEFDSDQIHFKSKKQKSAVKVPHLLAPKKKMSIILSYEVIMNCDIGRQHLNRYLKDKENYCTMIEFIEMIDHMESQPTQSYIIGRQVFKAYVKTSKPIYNFDKTLITNMENFLKGDTSMSAFTQARTIIYNLIKDKWYASFLISPEYLKLVEAMGDNVLPKDRRSASCNDLLDVGASNVLLEEPASNDSFRNPFAYFNDEEFGLVNTTSDTEDSLDDASSLGGADSRPPSASDSQDAPGHIDGETISPEIENFPDENTPLARSMKIVDEPTVHGDSKFFIEEDLPDCDKETANVSESFRKNVDELDVIIERKQLALKAMQTAQQETHNTKIRAQFDEEMLAVNRDIEQLRNTRSRYMYHISRIDRWVEFAGQWMATVYNITTPASSSMGSKLRSTLPFAGKSGGKKQANNSTINVELLVDLPSTAKQPFTHGWLVTHELSDFHWLRRQLSQISPWLIKLPLPSTRNLTLIGSKYNERYVTSAKEQINLFLKSILYDPQLCQSESVFHFLCLSVEPEFNLKSFPSQSVSSNSRSFSVTKALRSRVDSATSLAGRLQHMFTKPREGSTSSYSTTSRIRTSSSTDCLSDNCGVTSAGRSRKSSMSNLLDNEPPSHNHPRKSSKQSKQSLSDALFDLVEQLFQLKSSFDIPRRSLMHLVQVFYGKSLSEVLGEYINWLISEAMIFYYLESFKTSYFPDKAELDTKLMTPPTSANSNESTDKMKLPFAEEPHIKSSNEPPGCQTVKETPVTCRKHFKLSNGGSMTVNEAGKRLLWDCVPDHVKMLCGTDNCANGIGFVYETLQNQQANKALFYRLLQSVLEEVFNDCSM